MGLEDRGWNSIDDEAWAAVMELADELDKEDEVGLNDFV